MAKCLSNIEARSGAGGVYAPGPLAIRLGESLLDVGRDV